MKFSNLNRPFHWKLTPIHFLNQILFVYKLLLLIPWSWGRLSGHSPVISWWPWDWARLNSIKWSWLCSLLVRLVIHPSVSAHSTWFIIKMIRWWRCGVAAPSLKYNYSLYLQLYLHFIFLKDKIFWPVFSSFKMAGEIVRNWWIFL